jgi:D-arabinose 1-dehydrogenase-like Zn-dependent alcohol dehydrogenase
MTEETIPMKAIVVTDQAVGTAAMKLVERREPQAAINDVVVQVHASRFAPTERAWPSTWTDRLDRDRTPSIPGHELARHEAAVIGNSHGAAFRAARLCRDVVHA